ncbi:putative L-2,4-diaminobutyrate decarboxylase [Agrobacterium rubi TR3 = NBRC 13261]|uniref:Putative L-2,4-diaminobutyrate decarboxylase n=1 Tax=Agrobacterium rubi TR3 = NBRC 13261 TaxID=1368415 RepID=A0A081CZ63_9HYPH|nr:pyridoxal-dependent decarboxylase [Agrobacterium rubi]MBP1880276.1 L-2,4-diaminobutyrate decarboxylase [Agrobacterium rubi]GAK71959.1 putative L-2,4-diaminobutyrate decarboxylase [Agrobacterium rubi TR3 = NBRC 13261]
MTSSQTSDLSKAIDQLYDPETFSRAGEAVLKQIAEYLSDAQARVGSVLTARPPEQNMQDVRARLKADRNVDPANSAEIATTTAAMIGQFFANTQRLHHPGYIGHQLPPAIPIAALFEFAADVANQGMAIYELGPWATAVEKVMVERLGEQLGFEPNSFSGLVTSGGTLANLTALLTARNKLLDDVWKKGLCRGATPPVIITHMESHYSVERAAGILGIGSEQCLYVASDRSGRTDPVALAELLESLKKSNTPVIAVVASACATRTGSFDPLHKIADLCEKYDVWLHVDAAHGGAVSFSSRHRHLIEGIERADSVIWDAHKMLFMPTLSTYLFYKRPRDKYVAFSQDAPFLFVENGDGAHEYDCGLATAECTKRAAALSLWGVLSIYGTSIYETLIDRIFDITAMFVDSLSKISKIEMPVSPEFNIVLFRYVPSDASINADAYNKALRVYIVERGGLYLTTTTYNGVLYLRFVVMNPRTDDTELNVLVSALHSFAESWETTPPPYKGLHPVLEV